VFSTNAVAILMAKHGVTTATLGCPRTGANRKHQIAQPALALGAAEQIGFYFLMIYPNFVYSFFINTILDFLWFWRGCPFFFYNFLILRIFYSMW